MLGTATSSRRARSVLITVVMGLIVLTGCIDNTVDPELVEVDFLVGRWESTEMLMISEADPEQVVDLVQAFDATFTLDVEPSGRYMAELALGGGTPQSETGSLAVEGDSLVFTPDAGPVSRSRFEVREDGRILALDGDAEFDFDGDFEAEPATLHLELEFL